MAQRGSYRWEFEHEGQKIELDVSGSLVLDDMALMTEAALADMGLACLDERLISAFLDSGRLIPVKRDVGRPPIPERR